MRIDKLNLIIENKKVLDEKIKGYLEKGIIRRQAKDKDEILGHLEKAQNNLKFVQDNLKLGYFDWVITGCYYSVYHAALALILQKEYISKNHDATLCILVKEFYKKEVNEDDLRLINKFFLEYQDLLFYVQSKSKREEASYSTKYKFDKKDVEELRLKAIEFVNKIRGVIENEDE